RTLRRARIRGAVRRALPSAIVIAVALIVYFIPPPVGVPPAAVHACALVLFAVGLWAISAAPEHVVGIAFLLLAMLTKVAPAEVVFSGFASATLWLVFG